MNYEKNSWIGFCQYRRYWLKENCDQNLIVTRDNLKDNMLREIPSSWSNHDAVVAKRVYVNKPKFMKLVKRGFRNIISDPSVIFDKKKQNIKLAQKRAFKLKKIFGDDLLDKKEETILENMLIKIHFLTPIICLLLTQK